MSVIITGMDMPKSCYECPFLPENGFCMAVSETMYCGDMNDRRREECPLKAEPCVDCEEGAVG